MSSITEIVRACKGARRHYRAMLNEPGINVFSYGPAGVGKTWEAYNHLPDPDMLVVATTWSMNLPVFEIRGTMMVTKEGGAAWMDGPLVEAMRHDFGRYVGNDIHLWSDDCEGMLFFAGEKRDVARYRLPNPDEEMLRPNPNFQMVLTSNESVKSLPQPIQDRFRHRIYLPGPSPEAIDSLDKSLWDAAIKTSFIAEADYKGPESIKEWPEANYISFRTWESYNEDVNEKGWSPKDTAYRLFGIDGESFIRDFITTSTPNSTAAKK